MPEAQLKDSRSGLAPATVGWFVVNVHDAEWWFADSRGARCAFENEYGDQPAEGSAAKLGVCAPVARQCAPV